MIRLPFKRAFLGLAGKWYPDTNFPLFDINKLREISHDDDLTISVVFREILDHEWWHNDFYTSFNGTSFNTLRLAQNELIILRYLLEHPQTKEICELKTELIENEVASHEIFQGSKNVMEALNAYELYGEEQILAHKKTDEPIINRSIETLENIQKNGKIAKETLDFMTTFKRKFRELILSNPKIASIYQRLVSLKEASHCTGLPMAVCSLSLDHPFLLQPKNLIIPAPNITPEERCLIILDALDVIKGRRGFENDRFLSNYIKTLNSVENKSTIDQGKKYKLTEYISALTGLYFNFYPNGIQEARRQGAINDKFMKIFKSVYGNPVRDYISNLSEPAIEDFIEAHTSKEKSIIGTTHKFFSAAGFIIDDKIVIARPKLKSNTELPLWTLNWCHTYVKDKFVYSNEISCPAESIEIDFQCPLISSCTFIQKARKMKSTFDSLNLPAFIENKFNEISKLVPS